MLIEAYKIMFPKFRLGRSVTFNGSPFLRLFGKATFGDNLLFNNKTQYNTIGLFKNCSIFVDKNAELIIGNSSGFSGVSIHCQTYISIGSNCNFGGNVCIWDTDFHSLNHLERRERPDPGIISKPIVIGDDVFVGANSIILKGVTIGDRAIIGAGSVITKDIPADQTWAGNPAKFLR